MKILAYTSPARGHLYPLVPILDELAGRGHCIAVRTLALEVGLMSERGFAAAPIAPAIESIAHDDYRARTPPAKLKRGMATFGERSPHEVADLRTAIDAERPDAILVDCMTWGATAVAESWGGPWAHWFPFPLAMTSRDVPPFGPGLKPATGTVGRARDRLLRPVLTGTLKRACFPTLNATRKSVGVRPFATTDEMFGVAPLLLYMTAEPFEYQRSDWPPSVRMVGPCCWEPPAERPAWVDELARPLVLVTTSSEFQDDGRLVRTALDALANEDVEVVATMPSAQLSGPRARQRSRRALRAAHTAARSGGLCRHARRRGSHSEGARLGCAGVCRPVRARPAGGRSPSRGRGRRHATARPEAEPGTASPADSPGDDQARRRSPRRLRVRRDGRSIYRRRRIRIPVHRGLNGAASVRVQFHEHPTLTMDNDANAKRRTPEPDAQLPAASANHPLRAESRADSSPIVRCRPLATTCALPTQQSIGQGDRQRDRLRVLATLSRAVLIAGCDWLEVRNASATSCASSARGT